MILLPVIYTIVLPLMCLALVCGFVRLVKGPTLPDRIVAFELISTTSAGIIVINAIISQSSVLLDVASVWAVVSFLSVVAFSYYIEKWRGSP